MVAPLDTEELKTLVQVYYANNCNKQATADVISESRETVRDRLKVAAKRGLMLDSDPAMPGFNVKTRSITTDAAGNRKGMSVKEVLAEGEETFEEHRKRFGLDLLTKATLHVKDGHVIQSWPRMAKDADAIVATRKAMFEGLCSELPRIEPSRYTIDGGFANPNLLNQYTVTDLHFGMLAWAEENLDRGWDLKVAERTMVAWFREAIRRAPLASTAIFAQLGDMMHHDALKAVTPGHGHVLDADSRLQKVIRVVIRVIKQIVAMLLDKYQTVHVVMCSGNHDEASGIWLRELFHMHYENEPRVTIDNSASKYFVYQWGKTGLYYHHGDKRRITTGLDKTLVSLFREIYGQCKHNYAHSGHLHHKHVKEDSLMVIEQHRTLAPGDSHSASGGWISGSSADVITYHKEFGDRGRQTISPEEALAD